jgi:glycosyltransferase involved in cell wall biosynthesis
MNKPLVTCLLTTFNHQRYLPASIDSILQQTYSDIEIIISDDASSDDSYEIARKLVASYQGPHRVWVRKNIQNLGVCAHLNELIQMASGELIVVAAGDDISSPNRIKTIVDYWLAHNKKPLLMASYLMDMDESGTVFDPIEVQDLGLWKSMDDWMRSRPSVIGAAHAWSKQLFEQFGQFPESAIFEDQVAVFRAILLGRAHTIPEPLVLYRRGGVSSTLNQKNKSDAELRKQWRKIKDAYAVHAQFVEDAKVVGRGDELAQFFSKYMSREKFLLDIYQSPGFLRDLNILTKLDGPDLGFRFRKYFQNYGDRQRMRAMGIIG